MLASWARRMKCFLHLHVHAPNSERYCESAHFYRLDLAFAARMYVSSIDLNYLVVRISSSVPSIANKEPAKYLDVKDSNSYYNNSNNFYIKIIRLGDNTHKLEPRGQPLMQLIYTCFF